MSAALDSLNTLLVRSAQYAEHLRHIAFAVTIVDASRVQACANAGLTSLEHAHAIRVLFANGAPISACALLRAQYEAVLRNAAGLDF